MIDFNWIDKIPDGWEVLPLKNCFSFGKGLSITKADLTENGLNVLSYGQIHSKQNPIVSIPDELLRHVSEEYSETSPASLAEKNGFIFADTSEDLDGCGNCSYVDRDDVYAGYHTIVLKPVAQGENWKYLAYLFQTDAWRYQLRKELTEVKLYSVSQKVLKQTSILVPPKPVREAIVSYLDAKCAAIDEAIERHKKIIERLEEFKKAQVAHLVFNGINNSHKNKRNNNRFGEIPEDWKVVPTKSLFTFDKGLSITKADLTETGVPVLSYGQIHSRINSRTSIDDSLLRFVPKTIADAAPNSLGKKNGFIFADTSEDLDGCGNCNYIDRENVYAGYHTVLLNPRNTNEDYRYLSYLFQTDLWRHQIRKCLTEVKVYSISQKVLKSTWILLPSKKEQEEIVQRLEQMCKKINESKSAHADVIIKLEEYRKSIIYNAVTGKIDCRTETVE